MGLTKQIHRTDWADFAVTFSSGNKGRAAEIQVLGGELGAQTVMHDIPFFAFDYDPEGKGNDIVLSMGEEAGQRHTIENPTEVWQQQNDGGTVASVEIVDQDGIKTILAFSA